MKGKLKLGGMNKIKAPASVLGGSVRDTSMEPKQSHSKGPKQTKPLDSKATLMQGGSVKNIAGSQKVVGKPFTVDHSAGVKAGKTFRRGK